ncbi:hypothetical protein KCP73_01940 [Salmonella enterica subsp. enterica]|nr:hypothetical protein KCP73_01940 [Salmonella enterica subsp. enterica]
MYCLREKQKRGKFRYLAVAAILTISSTQKTGLIRVLDRPHCFTRLSIFIGKRGWRCRSSYGVAPCMSRPF